MSARILITGSREWTDTDAIITALSNAWHQFGKPDDAVLVSGACPTGADAIAEAVWGGMWSYPVERHPADWETHGKAAGPLRNQQMVDLGADVCLAFPLPGSRGTKHCMAAAEKAGIPIRVYKPEN